MADWSGPRVTALRDAVLAHYGPVCWLCMAPIADGDAWDIDHVIPRSVKGSHDGMANLRPAHAVCNRRRGTGVPTAAPSWPL